MVAVIPAAPQMLPPARLPRCRYCGGPARWARRDRTPATATAAKPGPLFKLGRLYCPLRLLRLLPHQLFTRHRRRAQSEQPPNEWAAQTSHYLRVILLGCNDMDVSKEERLAEFLRRLKAAPGAASGTEASDLVADTLNAVENELTTIPYDISASMTDGRMYPPQADSARTVSQDLTRYRNRGHNTLIHVSGAIRIENIGGTCLLSKAAQNGYTIPDQWSPKTR